MSTHIKTKLKHNEFNYFLHLFFQQMLSQQVTSLRSDVDSQSDQSRSKSDQVNQCENHKAQLQNQLNEQTSGADDDEFILFCFN